jgi:hypothetical protein
MDTSLIVGIIGTIASVISVIVAVIQYMKYRETKNNLKKLKNVRSTQIWGSILLTLEAYNTLNEAKDLITIRAVDNEIATKIVSARKSIVAQYLRLLEQAILDEECFTEETAREWRDKGLLENEWRFQAALKLIQNKVKTSS